MLAGRLQERAAIGELLDGARASRGGVVVLRGEAGSGKSALIADAAGAVAEGMTVLRTEGVESESPLPFAALQRLLRPLRSGLAKLAPPQRAALSAALGEEEGESDRFLVYLGALSLLADAAEERPVLAIVDDAQWLDEASAAALLFVSRRLQADRLALLFAVRADDTHRFDAAGLTTITLGGLDRDAALELLRTHTGHEVSAAVRDALVSATGGNPLGLSELAGVLSPGQLAGDVPLPNPLPLTDGVERGFLDRYHRLPEATQQLLLIAATDDTGLLLVINDAAARLGVGEGALEPAERAGLVRVDDTMVTLYHPLVRSAIYRSVTSAQRRAAHRALAESAGVDDDRRAWHLAAGIDRPDEQAASAMDAAARRAIARGGHEAAAAAWERAAELTLDQEQRALRVGAAAQAAWLSAQPDRARTLSELARANTTDPLVRADLDKLRARVDWNFGSPLVGQRILLSAAGEVRTIDAERARAMSMLASAVVSFVAEGAADMAAVSRDLGDPGAAPDARARCYALLLSGFVHFRAERFAEAAGRFREAIAESDPGEDTDLRSNLGIAALHIGDDALVRSLHAGLLAQARDSGALVLIVYALTRRAFADIALGDWDALAAGAAEAMDLARSSGQRTLLGFPLGWLAVIAALRDDSVRLDEHLQELERAPSNGVTGPVVADLERWARGVSAETPAAALHHFESMSTTIARVAALDRLEAAARAERRDLAVEWSGELQRFGSGVEAEWALAAAAYGRALVADEAEALAEYEAAIGHAAVSRRRFDAARIHLGYGEYLRRARRRVDARDHLRTALRVFEDIGATRWATRAAQELRASGETARRRDAASTAELTAQEAQVAGLIRQGLSNRDAAAHLFLSPRTVEFHLRNVFTKLGVTSRSELIALQLD